MRTKHLSLPAPAPRITPLLRAFALALAAALLLGGCRAARGNAAAQTVRLFAVNVGKGDALLLRAGSWTGLVDTGKARAMGRVTAALARLGVDRLDGVFLTHTDADHAGGLAWLAASGIPVDNWYASGAYTGVKEKKHPAVLAAEARGDAVQWLWADDAVPLGDSGATLRVLAPAGVYEDEDDNSLVMMLDSPAGRILLTGDMELPEEAELLAREEDLRCQVLKVPNHGDDDASGDALVQRAAAQVAVISTDSLEKPGTPAPALLRRLAAAGSKAVVTQDAGLGWLVTLTDGTASAEAVDFGAAPLNGVTVSDVDPKDDTVTLYNAGSAAADLAGCYLHSDRGDELFAFPAGTTLPPGECLVVGTNSTDGDFDLLWDDKKVVNQKKTDTVTLYDACGRAVDWQDNGK